MEPTIANYSELGRRAVNEKVGSKTLEARVKKFQREKKISNEQAGEIVTGFVDEAISKKKPRDAYNVVEGFGRFLYNGEYDEVRSRILQLMGEQMVEQGDDDAPYNAKRFFGEFDDMSALNIIAEQCINDRPDFALELSIKDLDKFNDIAGRIIELHKNKYDSRQIVARCLSIKDDKEGLVKLARKYAGRDPDFAWNIFQKDGGKEDYVWFAQIDNVKPAVAYEAIVKYKAEHPILFKRIRTRYINADPIMAGHKCFEDRFGSYSSLSHKECVDKEGILEVSRVLLKSGKTYNPVMAAKFLGDACLHDAPELKKAEVAILKLIKGDKIGHMEIEEARRLVTARGAIAYLKQGGNAEIANDYISSTRDDDINRELGMALSELPKNRYGWHVTSAYKRIAAIKEKTREDEELFARLRKRVLKEAKEQAGQVFVNYSDAEGIQQFIEQNIEKHPIAVYQVISSEKFTDKSMMGQCREYIAGLGMKKAREFFEKQKDVIGLQMVKEKFYENIDAAVAEELLG